ncbi:preprotein translocase subunit Sec61beta [Thermogladius sp. 4427co]|uniref:preprotein translocase subunit Sec61beta n=1 Tax=Thermogladius sp. 4427co TaxID=3450718 RepID=UPI003F7B1AF1
MSKSRRRREVAVPLTAAGLVRFYEESDVGIKIKPYVLIVIAIALSVTVIVLQKIHPLY